MCEFYPSELRTTLASKLSKSFIYLCTRSVYQSTRSLQSLERPDSMAAAKAIVSRSFRPPVFVQKIVLSDGSTYQKLTTSPRPSIRLTKDIRNAQLWNPDAGKSLNQEENGRLARFRGRFAGFSPETASTEASASGDSGGAVDDMDWMVSSDARQAPKMSDREMRESNKKKSSKGKK